MMICIHLHGSSLLSVGKIPLTKDYSRFGRVIGSFPFQTKQVPYIVLVLLIELVVCHLAERLAPKYERLLDWQTEDLNRLPHQP